jgi:hypothetical protein
VREVSRIICPPASRLGVVLATPLAWRSCFVISKSRFAPPFMSMPLILGRCSVRRRAAVPLDVRTPGSTAEIAERLPC